MREQRYIRAVLLLLSSGREYTAQEIRSLTGLSLSATYSALRTLIIQGKVCKSGPWRAKYRLKN